MRSTMMPLPAATETLTSLAWLEEITPASLAALDITDAEDLWVDHLPGETDEERAARLTAGADILHDRLSEIASHVVSPEVLRRGAQ